MRREDLDSLRRDDDSVLCLLSRWRLFPSAAGTFRGAFGDTPASAFSVCARKAVSIGQILGSRRFLLRCTYLQGRP